MKTKIHAIAGMIGFLTIAIFWMSTIYSELFTDQATIAIIKAVILKGMFVLVPAMVIVGASGMSLGGKRQDRLSLAKKKRMPIIAVNGILILVPAAFYLESKAASGGFDMVFNAVQIIELLAGFTNLALMGLNIRDGLTLTGRIGVVERPAVVVVQGPAIEERQGGPLVAKGNVRLTGADGALLPGKPVVALCRCGASKTKPFCDGSHNEAGFDSSRSAHHTPDGVTNYQGRNINVHYNRLLCSHAGECGKHLKSVFDSGREPWIVPDNGNIDDIKAVVEACPSGALRYSLPNQAPCHAIPQTPGITVERDGPYRVVGTPLISARLAEGASAEKYVLCRCGSSKNKPYCDGTHAVLGWRG